MLQNPVSPQDSWVIGNCYYNPGCTNPAYIEYDPNADFDDGSCQTLAVLGCTDSTAINFNPWADNNDGSCILPTACGPTEFECQVSLTLDNYPGETGWIITTDNGTSVDTIYQVTEGTYDFTQAGSTVNTNFCVPADLNTFVTFILTDSYGDGLAGSTTGGTVDGDVIVENISCGDTIFELGNPAFGNSVSSATTNANLDIYIMPFLHYVYYLLCDLIISFCAGMSAFTLRSSIFCGWPCIFINIMLYKVLHKIIPMMSPF